MGRTRPPYPPEFRAEAVRLVRTSGTPLSQVARRIGTSPQTLASWVAHDRTEPDSRDALTVAEREDLVRLRRENVLLRQEADVLRRAAVLFARGSGPDRD